MRRFAIGAVIVLLCWPVGAAQNASLPPLQRIIEKPFPISVKADTCGHHVGTAVHFMGAAAGVLTGVERVPGLCDPDSSTDGEKIELQGLRFEDALDKLIEIDPRYRWAELDGVIVMRPLEAWSDANNVLNRKLSGFVMHEGNFARALSLWRAAAFGDESPSLSRQPGRSEHAKRKFSVNAGPLPLSDVLDAIVRAHGALSWMVSYKAAPATLETMVVDLHTFDGEATLTQHYPRQE